LQAFSLRLREFNQHFLREVVQSERLAVIARFSRSIVHDLKNPLTVIGLTTELACAPMATPEFRAIAHDRVRKQIDRINELIGEILNFTQGADSSQSLSPTNYREFFNQILEDLREEAAIKSTKLRIANPPPNAKLLLNPTACSACFNLITTRPTPPSGGDILCGSRSRRANSSPKWKTPAGHRTGNSRSTVSGVCDARQNTWNGPGFVHLQKIVEDHGGRSGAQRTWGGSVFAFALPTPKSKPDA
jgi:K+-sensing histidine kinase KdpD